MLFNVVLDFFFEFLCRLGSFDKHDARLYNLTSDLIRCGRYPALKHVGQLHNNALNLKRSYTIARGFDNIIGSADIPIKSVLVAPRNVTRMIISVVPDLFCFFFIFIISCKKSARHAICNIYNNFAGLSRFYGISVRIYKFYIIYRRGLTHRTDFVVGTCEISYQHCALCLSEAL